MYETLKHPLIEHWAHTRPIPKDREIRHSNRRAWVAWIQTILTIFEARPSLAVDKASRNANPKGTLFLGFTGEDMYRGVSSLASSISLFD